MQKHRADLLFGHQFIFQKDAFQQAARLDLLGQKCPGHQLGFSRGSVGVLKVGVVSVDVEDTVVNRIHFLVLESLSRGHGDGDPAMGSKQNVSTAVNRSAGGRSHPAPWGVKGESAYLFLSASSTATATATVAPTMGLLPMPRKPIISTWAGTEEEPANWASECIRPMVSVMP